MTVQPKVLNTMISICMQAKATISKYPEEIQSNKSVQHKALCLDLLRMKHCLKDFPDEIVNAIPSYTYSMLLHLEDILLTDWYDMSSALVVEVLNGAIPVLQPICEDLILHREDPSLTFGNPQSQHTSRFDTGGSAAHPVKEVTTYKV